MQNILNSNWIKKNPVVIQNWWNFERNIAKKNAMEPTNHFKITLNLLVLKTSKEFGKFALSAFFIKRPLLKIDDGK